MDIGSLTGQIALEDQLTSKLTMMSDHVKQFAEKFDGAFGAMAIGVGAVTAAVVGMAISIVSLGEKGSTILGVEEAFDHLAETAGSTGEALVNSLSKGVRGTVDSMDLMKITSRALSAGVKLNADDMEALGETARAMGKAAGTDAAQGLQVLSSALTTGRTRGLALAGVVVDIKGAEEKLAAQLGVTSQELNASGKLQAARAAIMEAARNKLDQLGVSETSFKEKIQAGNVAIGNWFDSLAKSVASSAAVNHALNTIGEAFVKAFGGDSQTLLETIVKWVNRFADAVASYGPPIIQTVADIWHGIQDLWHEVQNAWDLVPDWFKNIATEAALAGGAVYLASGAFQALTPDVLGTVASFATITSGTSDLVKGMMSGIPIITRVGSAIQGLSVAEVAAVSIGVLKGALVSLYATLVVPVLVVALIAAFYQLGVAIHNAYKAWQDGKTMWEFFSAKDDDNFVRRWWLAGEALKSVKKAAADIELPNLSGMAFSAAQSVGALHEEKGALVDLEEAKKKADEAAKKALEASIDAWNTRQANLTAEYAFYPKLERAQLNHVQTIELIKKATADLATTTNDGSKQFVHAMTEQEIAAKKVADAIVKLGLISHPVFEDMAASIPNDEFVEMREKTVEWTGMLDVLADDLTQLAQVSGDTFGGLIKSISQGVIAFKTITDSAKAYAEAIKDGAGATATWSFALIGVGFALKSMQDMQERIAKDHALIDQFVMTQQRLEDIRSEAEAFGIDVEEAFQATGIDDFIKRVDTIEKKLIDAKDAAKALAEAQWQGVQDATEALNNLTADGIQNQAEFNMSVDSSVALFAELVKKTGDVAGALDKLGPTLDALDFKGQITKAKSGLIDLANEGVTSGEKFEELTKQLKTGVDGLAAFGQVGGTAIAQLLHLRDITEANQPLMAGIAQSTALLQAMGSANLLNSQNIIAFGQNAVNQFTVLSGATGNAKEAMVLMQPELQALWEHQQKFGGFVDEATQSLIDQAAAEGIVGETSRSVNDQILSVMKDIRDVLAEATGSTRDFGKAIQDLPTNHTLTVDREYNDEEPAGMAGGGVVYAARGAVIPWRPRGTDTVPAMLTPGETVLPRGAAKGDRQPIQLVLKDGRLLAEILVQPLAEELQRRGAA